VIIAITGASGFIGPRLIARLQRDSVTPRALGRRDPGVAGVQFARWDATAGEPPPEALRDVSAVIHLAGEPVAQRWSESVKSRIRESRVLGTRNLVNAIGRLPDRPGLLVSASAIGYYGDRGDEILTESTGPGNDFLANVCVEWEREALRAGEYGVRVASVRIGIVLGAQGGALKQMLVPFRAGVGGPAGSGRQWVSWIHQDDLVELLVFVLRNESLSGPLNATAPHPVRNIDFAKSLGHAVHRPSLVPTPKFALKMMFGEMAEVVLASQRVVPEAATRAGFRFQYPQLDGALRQLLT
jgi:uncharacterized protein (TIGR01777 family)